MKPSVVIESLRLTYDTLYMNNKYTVMLNAGYESFSEEEKSGLTRFLFEGFAFNNVMRWQPHQNWYLPEVKEFLNLFSTVFKYDNILHGYAMVEEFFKQLGAYTALMLTDTPTKDEWPYWFLTMYLRPAMEAKLTQVTPTPVAVPETESVFLIEQLWVDPSENYPWTASGYEIKGYVKSVEAGRKMIDAAGLYTAKGWPFLNKQVVPKMKLKEIKLLT